MGCGILSRAAEFALCRGISMFLRNYVEFDKLFKAVRIFDHSQLPAACLLQDTCRLSVNTEHFIAVSEWQIYRLCRKKVIWWRHHTFRHTAEDRLSTMAALVNTVRHPPNSNSGYRALLFQARVSPVVIGSNHPTTRYIPESVNDSLKA